MRKTVSQMFCMKRNRTVVKNQIMKKKHLFQEWRTIKAWVPRILLKMDPIPESLCRSGRVPVQRTTLNPTFHGQPSEANHLANQVNPTNTLEHESNDAPVLLWQRHFKKHFPKHTLWSKEQRSLERKANKLLSQKWSSHTIDLVSSQLMQTNWLTSTEGKPWIHCSLSQKKRW